MFGEEQQEILNSNNHTQTYLPIITLATKEEKTVICRAMDVGLLRLEGSGDGWAGQGGRESVRARERELCFKDSLFLDCLFTWSCS